MAHGATYFQLGSEATDLSPDLDRAHAEFAETRSLACCAAVAPTVLAGLFRALARGAFVSDMVAKLGHREIERPEVAGTAITLLLKRAPLFRWLEAVTGCAEIATVAGRVVQTRPVVGDELGWHDDSGAELRRLGVTIALDSPPYDGGEFEMRRVADRAPLRRFKHDRPGTALVFEVSPRLEHRVLPLTGGGPRRVYTGWFIG